MAKFTEVLKHLGLSTSNRAHRSGWNGRTTYLRQIPEHTVEVRMEHGEERFKYPASIVLVTNQTNTDFMPDAEEDNATDWTLGSAR